MGLFGKKKTPTEILAEGRALYDSGEYARAALKLLKASGKGNGEIDYWIGRCYLSMNEKKENSSDQKLAKQFFTSAAEAGHTEAARLLAEQFGVRDHLPQAPGSAPAPTPAPQPEPKPGPAPAPAPASAAQSGGELTAEELYAKGMRLFRAGNYEGAYKLLDKVCDIIYLSFEEDDNIYPAGQAALGWMCETGNGTKMDTASASLYYSNAIDNATGVPDRDGMAGMVRLAAKAEQPRASQCETALEYAKQLGTDEVKKLLPVLEQKLAEARKREAAEAEQKRQKEEAERVFNESVTASNTKVYAKTSFSSGSAAGQGFEKAGASLTEPNEKPKENAADPFAEGMAAYLVRDYPRALALFERAAEQGVADAQFWIGMMYSNGDGTAVDKAKALIWYEKAAEQGDPSAQFSLGVMHGNGEGTAVDKKKALHWYEKAAEQGEASAQYNTGLMYSKGEGTAVDKKKALYWYEKAAEQGVAKAQFNTGVFYDDGEGTAVDKKKALYWYEKAAEQGDPNAQFNLGLMYDDGEGTAVDKKKALYWYEKAAEQGHASAQINCGVMYFDGEGTAVDKKRARQYFQKAAAQTENKGVQEKAKMVLRKYF